MSKCFDCRTQAPNSREWSKPTRIAAQTKMLAADALAAQMGADTKPVRSDSQVFTLRMPDGTHLIQVQKSSTHAHHSDEF